MRRILFISALLLFLCVSSFGMTFDNHRRGFIIGGIGGLGRVTWSEFEDDVKVKDGTDIAPHTDFRMGGGFKGDKFMLYYWNVVNYFNIENSGGSNRQISGITGFGVSYYFKPTSPSLYINAGIGVSVWYRSISETNWKFYPGPGAMGGIGYEFARHWSVECGVMWSTPRNPADVEDRANSLAITLSIIGIAY